MEKNSGKGKAKEKMDFQGYGLRDNPKKSWKSLGFADDSSTTTSSLLKSQCKACGKEFKSMKALFGHMKHHSGRERKGVHCEKCGRKFQSLKALTGHVRLHPVKLRVSGESGSDGLKQDEVLESITVRRKRSKRMWCNNDPNSSLSSLNESSGLVDNDQEVEDAALCLIALSKGVKNWSEFDSFGESGDNNFDNSEIESFLQNKESMQNPFRDGDESFQMKKPRVDKSDSDVFASLNAFYKKNLSESNELDSGILIDKEKRVGSEAQAPNDMLRRVEFMVSKVDDESGFELHDIEIEERISGEIMSYRPTEVEAEHNLIEGLNLAGLGSTKSNSCIDAMFDACDAEPGGGSLNNLITPLNSDLFDDSQKKKKYQCRICGKTFKSYQALGGHQTSHRKGNSRAIGQIENCEKISHSNSSPETEASRKLVEVELLEHAENSVEQEVNGETSYGTRLYKMHEC